NDTPDSRAGGTIDSRVHRVQPPTVRDARARSESANGDVHERGGGGARVARSAPPRDVPARAHVRSNGAQVHRVLQHPPAHLSRTVREPCGRGEASSTPSTQAGFVGAQNLIKKLCGSKRAS